MGISSIIKAHLWNNLILHMYAHSSYSSKQLWRLIIFTFGVFEGYMYMYVYMCVHMCEEARGLHQVSFSSALLHISRDRIFYQTQSLLLLQNKLAS